VVLVIRISPDVVVLENDDEVEAARRQAERDFISRCAGRGTPLPVEYIDKWWPRR